MSRNDVMTISVTLLHQTEAAWLVEDGDGHQGWIAKSLGELDVDGEGRGELQAPVWLLEDKELS